MSFSLVSLSETHMSHMEVIACGTYVSIRVDTHVQVSMSHETNRGSHLNSLYTCINVSVLKLTVLILLILKIHSNSRQVSIKALNFIKENKHLLICFYPPLYSGKD